MELLDNKKEMAAQAAASAMAKQQEAITKIMQLQKQKALLKDRKRNILRYNLRYLDKLNAAEEKERLEQKEAEYKKLYTINLADSSKEPNYSESSSNLPPLS